MHLGAWVLAVGYENVWVNGVPSSGLMSQSQCCSVEDWLPFEMGELGAPLFIHMKIYRVSLCSLFSRHAKSRDNVSSPLLPRRQHSMYPTKLPAAHQIPPGVTRPSVQRCQVLLSLPRASWSNGSQAWSPREQGVSSSGHVLG